MNQAIKNTGSKQVPITVDPINVENNILFEAVMYEGKVCTKQTGPFPVTSIRGVSYVFILYSYNADAILSYYSRTELEITSYIHTPHVTNTSRKGDVSKNSLVG